MARRNDEIVMLLENISRLLAIRGESSFRVRAYLEAAQAITAMPEAIEDLHRADRLQDIRGVGPSIAAKIQEYLETGHSSYYEELKLLFPVEATELLDVPSIGPARAQLLHDRLGISTIAELREAATQQRLRTIPGFGARLEEKITAEAARVTQLTGRILLGTALPVVDDVVERLRRLPAVEEASPTGSVRRMAATVRDLHILVGAERPGEVIEAFTGLPTARRVVARGPSVASIMNTDGLQLDLHVARPETYGAALQYLTGSKEHNLALTAHAEAHGIRLVEDGLRDAHGQYRPSRMEAEVYAALGLDWIPPELRENRGEVEAAADHRLPRLVSVDDIRGDFHAHTDWSDGRASLERMVETAISRGYEYLAISDHSRSLRIAHGLSLERVREQHQLIARLNERYTPFRVLCSGEVDVLPDGSLDYPDDVLAEFDIVTASVHSAFSQPRERMTARILRALRNPHVDILGHPTGQLLLRRPAYDVDLEAVLRTAAEQGIAIEVNGQPDRLDLSDVWCRQATEQGVLLVCTSDAHSARQLSNVRYAVATARRGWAEPSHVLNTLPLERLLTHLGRRGTRARAA